MSARTKLIMLIQSAYDEGIEDGREHWDHYYGNNAKLQEELWPQSVTHGHMDPAVNAILSEVITDSRATSYTKALATLGEKTGRRYFHAEMGGSMDAHHALAENDAYATVLALVYGYDPADLVKVLLDAISEGHKDELRRKQIEAMKS